jgi:uncharacterized protein YecE (DUF72 family)
MELHVGCAMWTYAPWQGRYLPGSLSPRERLHAYATWCNAVEGNTTFYATPALDTVKSWAGQTTPDFRFVFKLPKLITHERRLADVDGPLRAFLAAIEPLDTTVLFGSPPVSGIEREAWRNKPRVPRRTRALTSHPIVRYIGRDDPVRTAAGWQPWADTVAGWLREGRSPTVFIHTPDNTGALELARRFHDDVRARVPEVEPLPEPIPAGPPTLF